MCSIYFGYTRGSDPWYGYTDCHLTVTNKGVISKQSSTKVCCYLTKLVSTLYVIFLYLLILKPRSIRRTDTVKI